MPELRALMRHASALHQPASRLTPHASRLLRDLRRAVSGVDVDRRRRWEHLLDHPAVLEGAILLAREVEVVVRPPSDA